MKRSYCIGLLISFVLVVAHGRRYGKPHSPCTPDFCTLPPDVGSCDAECPRYYYDVNRRRCLPFIYGCCEGNLNNFESKFLCKAICKPITCPHITCFVPPCLFQTCPAFPAAICRAVCPCRSVWLFEGEDVSSRCFNRG